MVETVARAERSHVEPIFFTPLNVFLFLLLAYVLYKTFLSAPNTPLLPPESKVIVFRTFTPKTLLPFNGYVSSSNPAGSVYLAVRGRVFDVSSGRNFYGPGGPYENFAGRDASRGLAKHSFEEEMLTKDLDGPLDNLKDLNEEEKEALQGWEERFESKYTIVGRLISVEELGNEKGEKEGGEGGKVQE